MALKRSQIVMTDAEQQRFLDEERVVTCATMGPGGRPHLMPLWYVVDGGLVTAWTFAKSQKVRNLERRPQATLQVEAGRDRYAELRGVMLECDVEVVRDPAAVEAMIEAVWQHYGTIDILVNNAAGNFASPTERLSPRAVDAVLGIVLHGTIYCTLALGKRWLAAGRGGRVLSIVTTYAWTGSGYVMPSAAAKAGVLAMTRSLAVEWARHGITLNAIAPGPFPTPGAWDRLLPDARMQQAMLNRVPLQRVGRHEELANLAAYLVADQAGYINGEVVTIDGGEWLHGAGEFNFLEALTPAQWDALAEQGKAAGHK
jgi:PPOX class probable F420-dependent enzyme